MRDSEAGEIVTCLTRSGSEFQKELMMRKESHNSTPVAIVADDDGRIVAWAATHDWRGMQTVEAYTRGSMRRRGLARLAAATLFAAGSLSAEKTTAVFSPHCVEIARSVGCREVRLFELRGDDWIENS
jgi:hypothetical protein